MHAICHAAWTSPRLSLVRAPPCTKAALGPLLTMHSTLAGVQISANIALLLLSALQHLVPSATTGSRSSTSQNSIPGPSKGDMAAVDTLGDMAAVDTLGDMAAVDTLGDMAAVETLRVLGAEPCQSHALPQLQAPAGPAQHKNAKCRMLQISEESTQAVDMNQLQSPGLMVLDQVLVRLAAPGAPNSPHSTRDGSHSCLCT